MIFLYFCKFLKDISCSDEHWRLGELEDITFMLTNANNYVDQKKKVLTELKTSRTLLSTKQSNDVSFLTFIFFNNP